MGWGRGGGKGRGQMSPVMAATGAAAVGNISATTTRPLGVKRKNSVRREGEGRKAGSSVPAEARVFGVGRGWRCCEVFTEFPER